MPCGCHGFMIQNVSPSIRKRRGRSSTQLLSESHAGEFLEQVRERDLRQAQGGEGEGEKNDAGHHLVQAELELTRAPKGRR